uniref:Uncharacterized protein n=1 Tax=Arundo donax TaxID=35708 RepID=A0A0A9C5Z6_ARUDO
MTTNRYRHHHHHNKRNLMLY